MINYNNISGPFKTFVHNMQQSLKKRILKTSKVTKRTYYSDTIATGRLYKSLTIKHLRTKESLFVTVTGTNYWREADSGIQRDTPNPTDNQLNAWIIARKLPFTPKFLREKIEEYGYNEPTSKFVTKNIPAFLKGLYETVETVTVNDLTTNLDNNLTKLQQQLVRKYGTR